MEASQELIVRDELPAIMDAAVLRQRVKVIQQVMRDVMVEDTHYGQIPGTPKPSLYQPGAEILCQTFGISIKCEPIEERIGEEEIFYRVRATAYNYQGREIGSREAVCSTREKKYRWRKPVHAKEWEAAPEHLRRVTWNKDGDETLQVRTEPGEMAETILAMANKRAHVAVTRQVTGCSGMFAEPEAGSEEPEPAPIKQPAPTASAAAPAPAPGEDAGPARVKILSCKKLKSGESDRGPWNLFGVKTSDGVEYTTFDQKLFAACMKAQAANAEVQISSEPVEGKSPRIVELVVR